MSYDVNRRVLFAILAVLIVLAWAPLRANASDAVVFFAVLGMIIGGYWGIEKIVGKPPKDD